MKTVVVWDEGDERVRPVGPTSGDGQLLRGTLDAARASHAGAEIVEWGRRSDTVAEIRALSEARARLRES